MADNEKQTPEEREQKPKQPNVQTDELEKDELEGASGGGNGNCGCGIE
jgi:hypothetical protein